MYVYFDKNGVLQEIVNDKAIRAADLNADMIYIYVEDDIDVDDIFCTIKKTDGTYTTEKSIVDNVVTKEIPYNKNRDMKYFKDYTKYKFYVYTFDEQVYTGLNYMTIRIFVNDSIYAQGIVTFNVEDSIVKSDYNITQSQYDYLLLNFASKFRFIYVTYSSNAFTWTDSSYQQLNSIEIFKKSRLIVTDTIEYIYEPLKYELKDNGYMEFTYTCPNSNLQDLKIIYNYIDIEWNLESLTTDLQNAYSNINTLQSDVENIKTDLDTKATITYVDEKIENLLADAPEAYDTLKEIADWIANDESGTKELVNRVATLEEDMTAVETDLATEASSRTAQDSALQTMIENCWSKDELKFTLDGTTLYITTNDDTSTSEE